MMLPFMQNELQNKSKSLEELRNVFLEADIDGSGFLSVDELYVAVRKVGAEVELNDIIDLMSELDVDRNGQLDIDEFIALMNVGSQLQFRSQGN
jgi:calcium-binding protein CML